MIPGVVLLGIAAIAEILGWALEAAKAALDELVSADEVRVDLGARLIFVFRGLDLNPPSNPNTVTSWSRTWHDIPACGLKSTIRGCLEILLQDRGPAFLEAFQKACPDTPRNHSGNRFRVGLGKGYGNQDTGTEPKSKDQEPNQDPEPGTRALGGPGGLAGSVLYRDHYLAGEEHGLGSGAGSGLTAPRPDIPLTFDDIVDDLDSPLVPAEHRGGAQDPEATVMEAPKELKVARAIIDIWNSKVAPTNPVFEAVDGRQAEVLIPHLMEALKDPLAESEFLDLLEVIPRDPFYAGENPKHFVAFLAHYAKQPSEARKKAVAAARSKLARLSEGDGKPSRAPKSTTQAAALRAAQSRTAPKATAELCNDIYNQVAARPKEA